MDKIRAVVVDHNAPARLAIHEVDYPTVGPNEALVRVAAVSVNAGEVRMAQSAPDGKRIGWDIAGTVEQPAPDGTGPKAGARVVGYTRSGGWAELVPVPTNALAELPDSVSFAQAATLPVAGLTALHSIEKGGSLLARNVLVTGANGGVGHFCCQLAKLSGATVVGQIRHERYLDIVKSFGADHVVVTEDGVSAGEFAPYRLITDAVAGLLLSNLIEMLAQDGVYVSYGASGGSKVSFDIWDFIGASRTSLYGLVMANELIHEPASDGLARLAKLVSDGQLRPYIAIEESWERVGEVVKDFLERKIPGKAVLLIK